MKMLSDDEVLELQESIQMLSEAAAAATGSLDTGAQLLNLRIHGDHARLIVARMRAAEIRVDKALRQIAEIQTRILDD